MAWSELAPECVGELIARDDGKLNSDRTLRITRSGLRIGRHRSNDYVIQHPSCSNCHFQIYVTVFEEGKSKPLVYCEDLNSLNGTWVNYRHISCILLLPGDVIQVPPSHSFTFRQNESQSPYTLDSISEKEKHIFNPYYTMTNRFLGCGGFGSVCLAKENQTQRQVACKIVDLARLEARVKSPKLVPLVRKTALREVEILSNLSHPNIINMHRVFVTNTRIYIFEELVVHGDLFSLMADRGPLPEAESMATVWQILKALEYLHGQGIVHRDLKPENVLCTTTTVGGRIVLTDFGAARKTTPATRMKSVFGTLEFTAPEILRPTKRGYSNSVDLWSLGIIVHILLSNTTPFPSEHTADQFSMAVSAAKLSHLEEPGNVEWGKVSALGKDFVKRLVCVDSRIRMTAKQARCHKWLARHTEELEDVYNRAVKGWKPRTNKVPIEEVIESELDEEGESEVQMSETDIVVPSSLNDIEENQDPDANGDQKHNSMEQEPYTSEKHKLLDSIVGDGKMRNVKEIIMEMEARKVMLDSMEDD